MSLSVGPFSSPDTKYESYSSRRYDVHEFSGDPCRCRGEKGKKKNFTGRIEAKMENNWSFLKEDRWSLHLPMYRTGAIPVRWYHYQHLSRSVGWLAALGSARPSSMRLWTVASMAWKVGTRLQPTELSKSSPGGCNNPRFKKSRRNSPNVDL